MEKNYLSGRLEFNPANHTWYLIDLSGSGLLKSDAAASFAARHLHENIFDSGVNANSIARYKNSFAANLSANSSLSANSLELVTNHYVISKAGRCFPLHDIPEAAITRHNNSRRLRSRNTTAGIISFALAALSSTALVNPVIAGNILPQGGVVASGSGSISSVNNGTGLQIKQSSQVLGLNWNSFSIGVGNQVIFDQPSSTSVAINRVVGNNRSEIFGSIQSNGQVFLLNPNGVLIARTAQIDTGAFVAATAQDAKRNNNGSWTVSGISNTEVINQGNIRANGQGGFIVLAGAQVSNEGSLQASSGVALAAGESVSLALDNNQLLTVKVDGAKLKALVQNKGIILADGGAVYLTASGRDTLLGTVVNNEGIIQARGVSNKGSRIILSGIGGDVLNSGKLDVSGKTKGTKGGLVALNGNRVAVTGNAEIDASGVAGGGRVVIGGDQLGKATDVINVTLSDHTVIGPNIRIDIGSSEGNGGFVETSGHQLSMQGSVVGASAGKAGEWLIDPNDVTISANTTANMSANPFTPTGSGAGTVNNGSIQTALNSGTDVTITTVGAGTAAGNITWSSGNISKTSGGNATLTLRADASITLTGISITSNSSALNVNLASSQTTDGTLKFTNTTIDTNGGNLTGSASNLTAGVGAVAVYLAGTNNFTLGAGNGTLTGTSNSSVGVYLANTVLNTDVANGSSMTLNGTSTNYFAIQASNASINLNSNSNNTGSLNIIGNATLTAGGQSRGIQIDTNSKIYAKRGNMILNGSSGIAGSGGYVGIYFNNIFNATIENNASLILNGVSKGAFPGIYLAPGTTINANVATNATFNISGQSVSQNGTQMVGVTVNLNSNNSYNGSINITGNTSSGTGIGVAFGANNTFVINKGSISINGTSNSSVGLYGINAGINITVANGSTFNLIGNSTRNYGVQFTSVNLTVNGNGTVNINGNNNGSTVFTSIDGNGTTITTDNLGAGIVIDGNGSQTVNSGTLSWNGTVDSGNKATGLYITGTQTITVGSGAVLCMTGNSTNYVGLGLYSTLNYDIANNTTVMMKGNSSSSIAVNFINGVINLKNNNGTTNGSLNINGNSDTGVGLNLDGTDYIDIASGAINLKGESTSSIGGQNNGTLYGNVTADSFLNIKGISNTGVGFYTVKSGIEINNDLNRTGTVNLEGISSSDNGIYIQDKSSLRVLAGTFNVVGNSTSGTGIAIWGPLFTYVQSSNATLNIKGNSLSNIGIHMRGASISHSGNGTAVFEANSTSYVGYQITSSSGVTIDQGNVQLKGVSGTTTGFGLGAKLSVNIAAGSNLNIIGASTSGYGIDIDNGGYLDLNSVNNTNYTGTVTGTGTSVNSSGLHIGSSLITTSGGNIDFSGSSTNQSGFLYDGALSVNTVAGANITLSGTSSSNTSANKTGINWASTTNISVVGGGMLTMRGQALDGSVGFNLTRAISQQGNGTLRLVGATNGTTGFTLGANISGEGNLIIASETGNITGNSTITSTGGNIIVAAGTNNGVAANSIANGNVSGGDIKLTSANGSITAGSGKTVIFYSGNADTANLSRLVTNGSISQHKSYSTAAYVGEINLNRALNVFYRVSPNINLNTTNITLLNTTKIYDGTTSINATGGSVDTSMLIDGDNRPDIQNGNITLAYSDKNVGVNKTIGGLNTSVGVVYANTNISVRGYNLQTDLSGLNLKANITKATITGISNLSIKDKTYDSTTNATYDARGAVFTGIAAGDFLTLSGTANFLDKNAGSNKSVTFTNITLGGVDAGNYVVDIVNTTINTSTATINKAYIRNISNITLDTRAYDGTTNATINQTNGNYSGVYQGDNVSITGVKFSDKNAGTNKTADVSNVTLSGADANNYYTSTSVIRITNGTITQAIITNITGITASNKTYDGSANATINTSNVNIGKFGSDDVTLSNVTASFSDKNAGTGKYVSLGNATLTGADAGNYIISNAALANVTTANIAAKSLTLTASAQTKTYDGSTNVTNSTAFTSSGLISGETISGVALAYTDKNAGTNKTISISGATAGANTSIANYDISYIDSTSSIINKRAVTFTAIAQTKEYDGNTNVSNISAYTISGSGIVAGENINVSLAYTNKNVGAANRTIAVSNAAAGSNTTLSNYLITYTSSTTSSITAKLLTITASDQTKIYSGNTTVANTTAFTLSGLVSNETISAVTLAYADKNVGTNKTIIASAATAGANTTLSNYNISYVNSTNSSITPKSLTITATDQTKIYDGSTNVTSNTAFNVSGLVVNETISAVTLAYSDKNAGNNKTITASGATAGANTTITNYDITYTNATNSSISQKSLTITAIDQSKTYDGATSVANTSAFTTSGLVTNETISAVTLAYSDKNAGTNKTITASTAIGGANTNISNYIINYNNSTNSSITPKSINITATAQSKTYDGNRSVADNSAFNVSGLVANETISAVTLTYSDKNAGANKTITASGATAGANTNVSNYNITYINSTTSTIEKKALTITATDQTKTYDSTTNVTNASAFTSSGLVANETISAVTLAYFDKNAGTNKTITASAAIGDNNTSLSNYVVSYVNSSNSTISKANITSITGVTLADKVYDGTTNASYNVSGANFAGKFGSDNLTLSGGTGGFASKDVGTAITVTVSNLTLGGTDAGNYNVVGGTPSFSGTANITAKALTVTALSQTKTYDGLTSVANTSAFTTSGLVSNETISAVTLAYGDKNAGTNKTITASAATAGANTNVSNYIISYVNNTSSSITPKALTVTALSQTKTYDGNTNVASITAYNVSGLVANETISAVTLAYSDKNAGANKTITASAATSGANTTLSNYNISYVSDANSSITPKALTVTALSQTKTYDGGFNVASNTAYNVSGLVSNETISAVTLAYSDKNAGTNKTITVGAATAGANTNVSNYNINYVSDTNSSITPKALTVTALSQTKTYDGATTVANTSAYNVSGLVANETISAVNLAYSDKNAGSNKTITASGATAGANTNVSNYNINYVSNTNSTINKANITGITGVTLADKVYDGTTNASFNTSGANFTGMIAGDNLTLSGGTGGFASKDVGTAITVTVSNLTLGGTDIGNYNFVGGTPVFSGNANISLKSLVINALSQNKTYDGSLNVNNANAFSVNGLISGEQIANISLKYDNINAGNGNRTIIASNAIAGNNTLLSNYKISYVDSTGNTIDKAELTITANQQTKIYDGTKNVINTTGATVNGLVFGENVSYSLIYNDKNVGTNKTISVTNLTANTNTSLSNYNVTLLSNNVSAITPKSITVTAIDQTKTYDGTTLANQSQFNTSGLVSGESISNVTIVYTDKNAGSNKIVSISSAIGDASTKIENYNINYVNSTSSIINKANLTVTVNNDSKLVTQADNSSYNGLSYSGFVGGENYNTSGVSGGTITRTNMALNQSAGVYNGSLSVSGISSNNYRINTINGNYTILAADKLLIKVENAKITYGTTANYTIASAQYLNQSNIISNLTLSSKVGDIYTYTDGAGGSVSFKVDPINGTLSNSNNLKVGVYQLSNNNTNIVGSNFNSMTLVGALTVEKQEISIASANISKVYDGNTQISSSSRASNVTLSGVISGDIISVQSVIGNFTDKNAGTNKSYNINLNGNLTGIDSENYYINTSSIYTGANGVIQKLNITSVSNIAISNKIYDGTTNANINVNSVTLAGAISGDNLTISHGSANFVDKNVGVNKTVNVTNLTLGGTDSGNYNLISSAASITGVASITPKSINIIANSQNKAYDGTTTVLNTSSYTVNGLVANESISGATMVFDSKNAGDGTKTILISNATQGSNTNLSNYDISYVHSTGNTISKVNITSISNIAINDKVYDGNKNATINSNNAIYSGKISGDNLTLVGGNGVFISKDVGTNISVTVNNYILGGADAVNYNLVLAASTYTGSANITPKALILTASSQTKTYDGGMSVSNSSAFTAIGLVANESIGSVNLAFTNKNAGTNKTITIGAASAGTNTLLNNYDISYVNSTTSTITKLQLNTATGLTASDKIYDGNTNATINKSGANFVGILNGDQVTIANATGNFNNESVGTNKLVTIRNFVASGIDAGNYDVSNVSANAYGNITTNSSIEYFDSTSTETYSSVIKFTVLNSTFTQTDNLSYATYEQFGYPTFHDFVLRKKTGVVIKKTVEISQSGVNKNIR